MNRHVCNILLYFKLHLTKQDNILVDILALGFSVWCCLQTPTAPWTQSCPGLDPSEGRLEVTSYPCFGYNFYCIWKIRDPLEINEINEITTHFSCGHRSSDAPDAGGGCSMETCKSCRKISPGLPSSPPPSASSSPWRLDCHGAQCHCDRLCIPEIKNHLLALLKGFFRQVWKSKYNTIQ